jgi:hypothetical protein
MFTSHKGLWDEASSKGEQRQQNTSQHLRDGALSEPEGALAGAARFLPKQDRFLPLSSRNERGGGRGEGPPVRRQFDARRRVSIHRQHQPPPAVLGEVASLSEPEGVPAGAARSLPKRDRIHPLSVRNERGEAGGGAPRGRQFGARRRASIHRQPQSPPAVLGEVASLSEPEGAPASAARSLPERDRILPLSVRNERGGGRGEGHLAGASSMPVAEPWN